MPAGIQYGVDATRELERLEEDVYVASRSETVHDEKGKSFDFMKIYSYVEIICNFYFAFLKISCRVFKSKYIYTLADFQ